MILYFSHIKKFKLIEAENGMVATRRWREWVKRECQLKGTEFEIGMSIVNNDTLYIS
jgi:hypothetical protein